MYAVMEPISSHVLRNMDALKAAELVISLANPPRAAVISLDLLDDLTRMNGMTDDDANWFADYRAGLETAADKIRLNRT